MNNEKSTFIVFDGEKIYASPNLRAITDHLIEVDKEVESLLNIENKLESLRKSFLELLDFSMFASSKLKSAGIEFEYKMKENPMLIKEKLDFSLPPRSYAIVLFAELEILRTFWTAYKNKTSDEKELKDASENSMKEFFEEFCLCDENDWIKNNPKRKNFSSKNLVNLRNNLTHFFGISKSLGVVSHFNEDVEKLQKNYKTKIKNISPKDLREISKSAFLLVLKRWTYASYHNQDEFKERIGFVKKIVEKNAPKVVSYEVIKKINEISDLNLKNKISLNKSKK